MPEATNYYAAGKEAHRLVSGEGALELTRSRELLLRFLPPTPAVIFDVGGGPGPYALWLATLGYDVHLLDAMPLHVEQAMALASAQPEHPLASAVVGDARRLEMPDDSVDAVLLMGPLYHLIEREDRVGALREALRVVHPGGVVIAVAISRYASTLDGLFRGLIDDPDNDMAGIIQQDLRDGQHRNPNNRPGLFTTSFFHRPEDLESEIEAAGLRHERTLAIEGLAWLLPDINQRWENDAQREQMLSIVRATESEPSVLGVSAHLMSVARKPG